MYDDYLGTDPLVGEARDEINALIQTGHGSLCDPL
jgi:hypothetical protein